MKRHVVRLMVAMGVASGVLAVLESAAYARIDPTTASPGADPAVAPGSRAVAGSELLTSRDEVWTRSLPMTPGEVNFDAIAVVAC
jgi:hypothetical protein